MNGSRIASLVSLIAVAALLAAPVVSKCDDPPKAAAPTADSMIGTEAGQVRDDNGLKMKLVWCPPGFVTIEPLPSPVASAPKVKPKDEKPAPLKALLRQGYWLGKYEVTQAEWKRVMPTEPWKQDRVTKDGGDYPTTNVDWNDATEFCRSFTEREHDAGRLPADWAYMLPTEAQWERACRARTDTSYSFGDDESKLGEYAWFADNARNVGELYAHRVGQKRPNQWGLHDMHGNVWEWCQDVYPAKLPDGTDPAVPSRVSRGGGWDDFAQGCRSAHRSGNMIVDRAYNIGFRVALTTIQPAK